MTAPSGTVVPEPAAQQFADATSQPPFLYELGPDKARRVLDDLQAEPIEKLDADSEWITVPAEAGDVRVRIVRPRGSAPPLPVVLSMHDGGWILGNADTHDRLVRELADGAQAAVVFVEYTRSPEAHYPVAIEQGYAAAQRIVREGAALASIRTAWRWRATRSAENMTAALALMAKERGDVRFVHQSMYDPVTDAEMNTRSYADLATGSFLTAQDHGVVLERLQARPRAAQRHHRLPPPKASLDQLADLPPAFLLVDEADVLRDKGEAYAAKLRAAGVDITTVRYDGTTHDFMMLNPPSDTNATRAALAQAAAVLRDTLRSGVASP
ncbi:alpha/beta hydrolase [Streptomyces sp. NPDC055506]